MKHLNQDNIITIDKDYGKNKIYFLMVKEKTNSDGTPMIKVGDTERGVEERNDETMTNASLHRLGEVYEFLAIKKDGKTFRDKSFHKFLENKGYERELNNNENDSEWFLDTTIEDLHRELEEFCDKKMTIKITLRPWQKYVYDNIIKEAKKYHLLSLATRFGKTFTMLDVSDYYHKIGEKIIFVPMSKSLASNASFESDYDIGGYTFPIVKTSLFKKSKKLIEDLKKNIPAGYKLIIVIDEADLASHTKNSVKKINEVEANFDIFKIIAMTGTSIYKAAKIFDGVKEEDIFKENITYSDLSSFQGEGASELVKRNFLNIRYDSCAMPDGLNIKQSFEQSSAHYTMAEYLKTFLDSENWEEFFKLQESNVIMAFVPGLKKEYMTAFKKKFDKLYNKEIRFEIINGDETTNRKSEKSVKKMIKKMKKDGDTRKLVLFSAGMSQRSFSIPEIRRVIILSDGEISATFMQMAARCLTYNRDIKNEQIADIIRITTEETSLITEVFMQEYSFINHNSASKKRVSKRFLLNSTFSEFAFDISGNESSQGVETLNLDTEELIHEAMDKILDDMLKLQDSVKYLVARFGSSGLLVGDVIGKGVSKSSKKMVKDTASNAPGNNPANKGNTIITGPLTKDEEKSLEKYLSIVRCLPYIGSIIGKEINSLEDLLQIDWEFFEESLFDKTVFKNNILTDADFKVHVESLYRTKSQLDAEEISKRNMEIFEILSDQI